MTATKKLKQEKSCSSATFGRLIDGTAALGANCRLARAMPHDPTPPCPNAPMPHAPSCHFSSPPRLSGRLVQTKCGCCLCFYRL